MDVLKIGCFNCNSVNKRSAEILTYVLDNDYDIFMLTETHLAQGVHYYGKPNGYLFYQVDHPSDNCRGGVGLLIKKSIKHFYDPKLDVKTDNFQSVGVRVSTNIGEIYIATVYCPPNCPGTNKEAFLKFFNNMPNRFIISGDYNAKSHSFSCRAENPRGKELLQAIKVISAQTLTDGFPTYYPSDPLKQPDILDFFVVRNISKNYLAVGSEIEMSSDHIPIKMAIHSSVILKRKNQITNSKTNWDLFRNILNESISICEINSIPKLEEETELISNLIRSAASDASPIMKYTNNGLNLPTELREMIRERRRARCKWQKSRFYKDRQYFEKVNRITTNKITEFRNERTFNFLRELTPSFATDYSLWKVTKYLKKGASFTCPLKKPDGTWTESHQEMADEFSRHLTETFKPHKDIKSDLDILAETAKITPTPSEPFSKITRSEVTDMIKYKIQIKKAPGMDMISGDMLKNLPGKAIRKLTDIFNASLELQWVPTIWKKAEVVLFHKKGKPPQLASSYRPISLLSIIGKLFERLFLKRLMPVIAERKILPSHQFGFRRGHSTIEQVHRITELIESCFEQKLVCSVALLDIAQAFDKVWLEGLALKMLKLLPVNYHTLLVSYLNGRSFRVRHEDTYSNFMPILAGVPQGSVLGPILFLIYVHDLPVARGTRVSTFADDTGIAAAGETLEMANASLQQGLDATSKFCNRWKIKLNGTKSQQTAFTLMRCNESTVNLAGEEIPVVNPANYLGMRLDARLTYGPHIKTKRKQVQDKFKSMWWLFRPASGVSIKNKLLLHNMILKPIWTYGCQLWGTAARTNIQKIQAVQSLILRGFTGVRWDDYVRNDTIHQILGVPPVVETIKDFTARYAQRLAKHPNSRALRLLQNCKKGLRRLKRRKPFDGIEDLD